MAFAYGCPTYGEPPLKTSSTYDLRVWVSVSPAYGSLSKKNHALSTYGLPIGINPHWKPVLRMTSAYDFRVWPAHDSAYDTQKDFFSIKYCSSSSSSSSSSSNTDCTNI